MRSGLGPNRDCGVRDGDGGVANLGSEGESGFQALEGVAEDGYVELVEG